MHIPQELLNELPKKKKQQPNGIEACSLKSAIKKSHIVLKYNQKTGQIRPVVKSKSTTAKSTKSVDDVWKKFIEKGRKGMRAVTYRQWCEDNNRSLGACRIFQQEWASPEGCGRVFRYRLS